MSPLPHGGLCLTGRFGEDRELRRPPRMRRMPYGGCLPLFPTTPESIVNLAAIEMSDGMFLGYIGALSVTGVIMLLLAITGFGAQSVLFRVFYAMFGDGLFGYGLYLIVTEPSEFCAFYYAFHLHILI